VYIVMPPYSTFWHWWFCFVNYWKILVKC